MAIKPMVEAQEEARVEAKVLALLGTPGVITRKVFEDHVRHVVKDLQNGEVGVDQLKDIRTVIGNLER